MCGHCEREWYVRRMWAKGCDGYLFSVGMQWVSILSRDVMGDLFSKVTGCETDFTVRYEKISIRP